MTVATTEYLATFNVKFSKCITSVKLSLNVYVTWKHGYQIKSVMENRKF